MGFGGNDQNGGGAAAGPELRIKKFDMNMVTPGKIVVLIGKRDTGKSFLVRDLLYHHRDTPVGTVVSPTERVNKFYRKFVPSLLIHDEFSPELMRNVVRRQDIVTNKKVKEVTRVGSSAIDNRSFLILDDCLFDNSWTKDRNIRLMFMNGRHYNTLFLITMQYPLGIPPALRTNIDFVFILRENIVRNRRIIYENFAGMVDSFSDFCKIMDNCTEDYECLVIHMNSKSNSLTDQIFWYKGSERPEFAMCDRSIWSVSDQADDVCGGGMMDDSAEEDDEDEYDYQLQDAAALRGRGGRNAAPPLTVKKMG